MYIKINIHWNEIWFSLVVMWQFRSLFYSFYSAEFGFKFHISEASFFQVTLLESRAKCEFKLWKPLKFVSGRSDCDSTEKGELRGFVTWKEEVTLKESKRNSSVNS